LQARGIFDYDDSRGDRIERNLLYRPEAYSTTELLMFNCHLMASDHRDADQFHGGPIAVRAAVYLMGNIETPYIVPKTSRFIFTRRMLDWSRK
jgi:hypothetical protein